MKIGIIGLGYVGQPLAKRFAEVKLQVLGFDIDPDKVDRLNHGHSLIAHITSDHVQGMLENGFEATTDFSRVSEVDAIIICVPTPLDPYRVPDLRYVDTTMQTIAPHLKKGQILSLESTTYPGTTDELIMPYITDRCWTVGKDFYLVYSPEREDPGNKDFDTQTIPKIVGGYTTACLEKGRALYQQIIDKIVPVTSTRTAEMVKLLENIHRAVNIGLVNEMKIVADKMDIDIFEVINAAKTKPFGFTAFYPGPGLGGHCIPIDPFYLTWKAKEYGLHTRFIELAGEINQSMPHWVIQKTASALNDRKQSVKGSKILLLGMAYKPDVDDMRESPSLDILLNLEASGAVVDYADPWIPVIPKLRKHSLARKSVEITPERLASYDCVLVLTQHKAFDYEMIGEHASLIIDARGCLDTSKDNVIRA